MDDLEYGTIYFVDASALIKLFLEEKGSGELRQFVAQCGVIYTTALCFGEALGVLKRKRFVEKSLSQDQYIRVSNNLRAHVTSNVIKFVKGGDLNNLHIFFEAADLSDLHEIDLSDALQIVLVRRSKVVGATLISADKRLVEAARKSGVLAWNCETEPAPALLGQK
jgi:predicted nucleic acid-binding protein